MTKVVVEGNSLGTGRVTLKAPNIAEDIVVELPALGGPIGGFPPGTVMLFVQTNAPTGWTKSTAHSNKALRVVTGTAGSGGTVDFSTAFTSQAVSGTVGGTSLSVAQLPSHSHQLGHGTQNGPGGGGWNWKSQNAGAVDWTYGTGSGSSHNHSFTGTSIDLSVKYVDVIIATKD